VDASLESVIVRVYTDEGIMGFGDAGSSPRVVRSIIDAPTYFTLCRSLRELLIGRDPLEISAIWEELYRMAMGAGRRGAYIHAISAIDVALSDIMGKAVEEGWPALKVGWCRAPHVRTNGVIRWH
jgi:L-rhamnonate dehydratase